MAPLLRLFTVAALLLASSPSLRADARANALFEKARKQARMAASLECDLELSVSFGQPAQVNRQTGKLKAMRPNYLRMQIKASDGQEQLIASTGKEFYMVMPGQKIYQKMPAPPTGEGLMQLPSSPLSLFFKPDAYKNEKAARVVPSVRINGRVYQVVQFKAAEPPTARKVFFGPTGWLEGVEAADPEQHLRIQLWLKNLRAPRMQPAQFAYTPPTDFTLPKGPEEALVEVGKDAPDFNLPQPGGNLVALSELRKGKKAVLVNFWFHGCPPCRAELPQLQKLYAGLKDQGFGIVAVNGIDSEQVIAAYWNESKFEFPTVVAGPGEKYALGRTYGVTAYPTNYLVDDQGKVVWRSVGFDEAGLTEALRKLGFKL